MGHLPRPFPLGEHPPLGEVPRSMLAQVVRQSRFGPPIHAFQLEEIEVPAIGPREVLVYVMAAGVNYNNVWAALGRPVDVIQARKQKGESEDFHIGGSDASGIVWKVGSDVRTLAVGDEVVIHCGRWDPDDPHVLAGKDPAFAPSQHIWGFESNYGSFAQYTRVYDFQCLSKPSHLSWEQAASYMLVAATAYRMLCGWIGNRLQKDDPVLVWGGAGGLGSMAIQIAKHLEARPVAVVSSLDKTDYCRRLGAVGTIDRAEFHHWGPLPDLNDAVASAGWQREAQRFGRAFRAALGDARNPVIVVEHPGEDTLPTSIYVVDKGGMVVICAGTSGFNGTLDLRHHWMRQKRLQGSHFANTEQCAYVNRLVAERVIDPCVSAIFPFDATGHCHQLMYQNQHPPGNMVLSVNSRSTASASANSLAEHV